MKVVFVSKYNDGYLKQIQDNQGTFKTYEEGIHFLRGNFYYHYGSLCHYLEQKGHQTNLIIPNFDALQNLWCHENKIDTAPLSEFQIIKTQIERFRADIVFLNSNFEYYTQLIPYLKAKNIKVCAWISCPIPENLDLSSIDHIFTLFAPHHKKFKALGISSSLTHGGFDERILDELDGTKKIQTSFIGGIGKFHKQREKFLKFVVKKTSLSIWGYGYESTNTVKNLLKRLQHKFVFTKIYKGEAWGKEMFKILNQSQITLNFHGDIAQGHAVNMRLFEATGAGTLLLTENSDNINQFFTPGKEVIVYDSPQEAIDKINYYLSHPKEAEIIAKAGQKKTLLKYNYKNMIDEYIAVFEELINNEK